ncbi:MAG: Lrp/AsnC ligand binding domain-containing protein [bacterium]|nr:Lrp/AsnC ligand binding domain-containing protein [bacterium]
MVTAIVLISAKRDRINETAEKLVELDGVSEVYSVAGPYDLAAIIRVRENQQLADLVTGEMVKLEGIEDTMTLIAFKAYSRHDLERLFSIGLEEETQHPAT